MRVIIDTNIILSAVLFPEGKVSKVLFYLLKTHKVIIASYSINECTVVFRKKFPNKIRFLEKFLERIEFELFETPSHIDAKDYPSIQDPSDVPVLASAILSDADILLTGDNDFSGIKVRKPLIFSPSQYFQLLNKKAF